jgi:hypothetical protein
MTGVRLRLVLTAGGRVPEHLDNGTLSSKGSLACGQQVYHLTAQPKDVAAWFAERDSALVFYTDATPGGDAWGAIDRSLAAEASGDHQTAAAYWPRG